MDNVITIKVFKDEAMWCAVYEDFINLQKSPNGYGWTQLEAITNLLLEEGRGER